ncbi:MAG: PQQ-binding-like beta-propeller repeat protein [Ktedonobacteraceae bacterium]
MRDQRFQSTSAHHFFSKKWKYGALSALALIIILAGIFFAIPRIYADQSSQRAAKAASAGDWPTYMYNAGRSGYNQAETIINQSSAPKLKLHWSIQSGGKIFSQPVVANSMVYWGSFDGFEHGANLSGHQVWQQNLGAATTCVTYNPLGVVSSAAVATVPINGTPTSVVFVGGGDDHLYALNAATGAVIWHTAIGNSSINTFIWDSPLVLGNNVYIGSATTGEGNGCKLIAGQFFELNASTGGIVNTFNSVPAGCVGGGIWSSPTYDASDGSIYFTAGTQGGCTSDHISIGIVKLRASDLTYLDSWQIPLNQRLTSDADFAGTPMLFTATIHGTLQKMVGAADKNGIFYAFNRASLNSGPVWSSVIAIPGACPQCGKGSISSAVWDGSSIYVAGGNTTIKGQTCGGSVQLLDPATGNFLWQTCLPQTVLGALTEVPGVIALVYGASLTLINSTTGTQLFNRNGAYYGSPSISNGVLYAGSTVGKIFALGI